MNFLSKSLLALSFTAISSFCQAMQLTDVEGKVFNLTKEQADAFKQCQIFTDYQDNIAKDETAENNITNQSKIWSFADCTNSELKAEYICKLMNYITDSNNINTIDDKESGNLFALSLYTGAPEHKIQKLAEKFYDYFQKNKTQLQLHTDFKNYEHLAKNAVKYLPNYPDMHAFIEDFNMRYVQNGHPVGWEKLIKKTTGNFYCLDLSLRNLQKLGFIKELHSLDGIERFANYLNCQFINTIKCNDQRISDFSINTLQKIFPNLQTLELKHNIIKRLHKKQFENMKRHFEINLNNNNIEHTQRDCFSLISSSSRMELFVNTLSCSEISQLIPISLKKKIINTSLYATLCASPFIISVPAAIGSYSLLSKIFKKIGRPIGPDSITGLMQFFTAVTSFYITGSGIVLGYDHYDPTNRILNNSLKFVIHCSNGNLEYYYHQEKQFKY